MSILSETIITYSLLIGLPILTLLAAMFYYPFVIWLVGHTIVKVDEKVRENKAKYDNKGDFHD